MGGRFKPKQPGSRRCLGQRRTRQGWRHNPRLGLSTAELANFIAGSIDFGEVPIGVPGSESVIRNLVLVNPAPPHEDLPFAFDLSRPLWLRVKTGGANILFTGARLNYRRKRVAV